MIGHTERRFTMSENENKVENIVAAVRSGDYSELDTLIKLCVFVPETAISAAQRLGFEHDDLRQEGVGPVGPFGECPVPVHRRG